MDANFHTVVYVCVCVYVDLYKGSYYCRLSNLLDINAPNICLLPIKKETQARQGARKVLVDCIVQVAAERVVACLLGSFSSA